MLPQGCPALLTPAEVARMHRVDRKTVSKWETAGRVTAIRTVGGHRRFPSAQFAGILAVTGWPV
jgi:excisionase family DNA binding protein